MRTRNSTRGGRLSRTNVYQILLLIAILADILIHYGLHARHTPRGASESSVIASNLGRFAATFRNESMNAILKDTIPYLHINNNDNNKDKNNVKTAKWAYAFVIGGIGDTRSQRGHRKGSHLGYLYCVAVAAYQFKYVLKSQADVVVFLQLSAHSESGRYQRDDIQLLESLGVKIKFIPRFRDPKLEGFYSLMLEKFRILSLTEYSRVLFMDSDMMPLCNLDYLFELSESPDSGYKENIVLGWMGEPAHGGFFLLKPSMENWKDVQEIRLRRETEALGMKHPRWDPVKGWGHVITAPDYIKTPTHANLGTNWTWHGSFTDQGLLYYYTKYFRKSVSFIYGKEVDHWGTSENGTLQLLSSGPTLLGQNYSCEAAKHGKFSSRVSPLRDFTHFSGSSKPWRRSKNQTEIYLRQSSKSKLLKRWFNALEIVSQNISGVPIQWDNFYGTDGNVGGTPSIVEMDIYVRRWDALGRKRYRDNDENPMIEG